MPHIGCIFMIISLWFKIQFLLSWRLKLVDPLHSSDLVPFSTNHLHKTRIDSCQIDLVRDKNYSRTLTVTSSFSMVILFGISRCVDGKNPWLLCSSHFTIHLRLQRSAPEIHKAHPRTIQPTQPTIQPTDFLLPSFLFTTKKSLAVIHPSVWLTSTNLSIKRHVLAKKVGLYDYQMPFNGIPSCPHVQTEFFI